MHTRMHTRTQTRTHTTGKYIYIYIYIYTHTHTHTHSSFVCIYSSDMYPPAGVSIVCVVCVANYIQDNYLFLGHQV